MVAKIIYFDIRGRAEPLRLMFEDLGVPYEDERIRMEDWPRRKGEFRFGQLPVLATGQMVIEESGAIFNYIARQHGLLPLNESELIVYDQLSSLLTSSAYELGAAFWNPDFKNAREDLLKTKLPFRLKNLETLYQDNARKPYWLASRPLHCDYHAWNYLDTVRLINDQVISAYPGLAHFKATFEQRPNIKAYLCSPRRPRRYTINTAPFGGHEDSWTPA